jgi:hypothetical protein
MKPCSKCGELKPLAEFNLKNAATDGRQSQCRACSRAWYQVNKDLHKSRVAARNARVRQESSALLMEYLLARQCVDCGEADVRVLEFDHRDSVTKRCEVTKLVAAGVPWPTVLAEIAKCDVRCANCHRVRTWETQTCWRSVAHDLERQRIRGVAMARLAGLFPLQSGGQAR